MTQEPQRNPQHKVTVATSKAFKSSGHRPVSSFCFLSFYTLVMWKNLFRNEPLHVEKCAGIYKLLGGYMFVYTDDN